jgi:hypothetical protein
MTAKGAAFMIVVFIAVIVLMGWFVREQTRDILELTTTVKELNNKLQNAPTQLGDTMKRFGVK